MAKKKSVRHKEIAEASLKNLKMWKKGQTGNPRGGKAHNPVVKAFKSKGREDYIEVLKVILYGTAEDLDAYIQNPESPNLGRLAALAFEKAIDNRDFDLVQRIAEQIFGKLPETLNLRNIKPLGESLKDADKKDIKAILDEVEDEF